MLFNGVELDRVPRRCRRASDRPSDDLLLRPPRGAQGPRRAAARAADCSARRACGWPATGPTPDRLRAEHGGDPRIEWLGRLSDAEKIARLRGATVFCAPSLHGESFGVVLIEAMAAGTPIVASALDGYRNVATDGVDALLVPPGDVDALAAALRRRAHRPGARRRGSVRAGARSGPTTSRCRPLAAYAETTSTLRRRRWPRPSSPGDSSPAGARGRAGSTSTRACRILIIVLDHSWSWSSCSCLFGIVTYNGLVRRRNQVENAWSQIDVQLKRRIDLIPNLVETVKGYAAHEKETLDAVINARNAAIAAPTTPQRAGGGRRAAHRRTAPAVRAGRGLPRPEGEPELPRPAGGADRHRGQGRLRAAVLQRHRARATTTRSSRSRRCSSPA